MNINITESFTLRDALLGFVVDNTVPEAEKEFSEFFAANPDLLVLFKSAFRSMMSDRTHTAREKCVYFLDASYSSEAEAEEALRSVWRLATRVPWADTE